MPIKQFAISIKCLAICTVIGIAGANPAIAQEEPVDTVFLDKVDGAQHVVVKERKGICSLVWTDYAQTNGLSFSIGKTVITSNLMLFSTRSIGEHAGQMTFRRYTLDGIKNVTTQFSKGVTGKLEDKTIYQYSASLNRLGLDFSVIEQSGDMLLQTETDGPAAVKFRGVLRDEAVEALGKCLETLPSHWSLDT